MFQQPYPQFPGQPYPQQPTGPQMAQQPPPPYGPPQGAPAWPPAPAQPQWGGPPAGSMPGPQMAQQPPQLSAPPSLPQVDPNLIAAAYQKAREEHARIMAGAGDGSRKFLSLTPPGVKDWKVAPRGSMVQRRVFLVPSKVQGALPFAEDFTHFWKGGSKPQGNSVPCLGPDRCPVCIGRELVQRNVPDEGFKKHVRDKAKVRRQVIYQVLSIDNPQEHQHEDGQFRPLFVRLGLDAHNAIGEKLGLKGLHTFFDAQHARPIVITKRKTGDSTLDIETTIDDLDPVDVHPWFWNVLANTHDFAEIARGADAQKFLTACQEMSLPMHDPTLQQALAALGSPSNGAAPQGQQPSFSPYPNAPNTNPYQQPTFGGAAANVQQWQAGPGHTGNTGPQPMQNQQWQGPPQPPAQPQGYYGAPQGYPQQGPQVPANVPPGLASTMMGRG